LLFGTEPCALADLKSGELRTAQSVGGTSAGVDRHDAGLCLAAAHSGWRARACGVAARARVRAIGLRGARPRELRPSDHRLRAHGSAPRRPMARTRARAATPQARARQPEC